MMALVVAISLFVTTGQAAMTSRLIRPVMMAKPALVGKIASEQSDNQPVVEEPSRFNTILKPNPSKRKTRNSVVYALNINQLDLVWANKRYPINDESKLEELEARQKAFN
jgi:hypothetical protein